MKENNDPTVNWKKELLEWLKILLAAAAIALFINTCVIANTRVPLSLIHISHAFSAAQGAFP